jgi:hypothetical protein
MIFLILYWLYVKICRASRVAAAFSAGFSIAVASCARSANDSVLLAAEKPVDFEFDRAHLIVGAAFDDEFFSGIHKAALKIVKYDF